MSATEASGSGRLPADYVRVHWCRDCDAPADLPCVDEGHYCYEAQVVPLIPARIDRERTDG